MLYAVITAPLPSPNPVVVALSLAYVVYYCGLSLYLESGGGLPALRARACRVLEGVC